MIRLPKGSGKAALEAWKGVKFLYEEFSNMSEQEKQELKEEWEEFKENMKEEYEDFKEWWKNL